MGVPLQVRREERQEYRRNLISTPEPLKRVDESKSGRAKSRLPLREEVVSSVRCIAFIYTWTKLSYSHSSVFFCVVSFLFFDSPLLPPLTPYVSKQ